MNSQNTQKSPVLVQVTRESLNDVTPADIEAVKKGKYDLYVKIPCEIPGAYRNPAVSSVVKIQPGENIEERLAEIHTLMASACLKCPNRSDASVFLYDDTGAAIYDPESNKCACKPGFSGAKCNVNELAIAQQPLLHSGTIDWKIPVGSVVLILGLGAGMYYYLSQNPSAKL